MKLIDKQISIAELSMMAKAMEYNLVKAVVDIEKGIMAVDAPMHVDLESWLLDHESKQSNLWGINLLMDQPRNQMIQFDSMINLRPSDGNRSRGVDDPKRSAQIVAIVDKLVTQ